MVQEEQVQRWLPQALGGNFGQDVHAAYLGGDPKVLAGPLLHPQYPGMAADPALFPGGQFGRENQDQLHICALRQPGLAVEEHAIRADVASLSADFRIRRRAADAHRQCGHHSLAGTSINLRGH
jgi:hypothetical protein